MYKRYLRATFAALVFSGLLLMPAQADLMLPSDALNFAVLYSGTGGHNLQITNVMVNGNIGVGGTGVVEDNGPSTVNGIIEFAAGKTGQFHNNNTGSNVITGGETYGNANITADLASLSSLSSTFGGEAGTNITISGNTTINASSGTLDGNNNRVFDVTSYSSGDGKVLTINGDGHDVVLNFLFNSNVNLGGDVTLVGLTPDQVLFNFATSGKNVSLNNNASSFPLPLAFQGIILAPNDVLSLTNANLDGRVFGGDSSDMQIVSGDTINAPASPASVPEPSSVILLLTVLALGGGLLHKPLCRIRQL